MVLRDSSRQGAREWTSSAKSACVLLDPLSPARRGYLVVLHRRWVYNFRAISGCSLMVYIPHLPTSQEIKPKFITVQLTGCFLTRQKCPPQHVCPSLAAPVPTTSLHFSRSIRSQSLCANLPSSRNILRFLLCVVNAHPSRCISNTPCSSTAFTVLPPPPSSVQIHCSPRRDPEDISSFLCSWPPTVSNSRWSRGSPVSLIQEPSTQ